MFNIPPEKLPSWLPDEERLNVLFGPLRNREVNQRDWEDKISSWKAIIKIYCEANNIFCFTLSNLKEVFQRHGRPPNCLEEVIESMLKNKEIEILESFNRKPAETWSELALNVILKPVTWSFTKMKTKIFYSLNDCQFVHLEVVKNKSQTLLSSVPESYRKKLINAHELTKLSNMNSKTSDIKLLLHYLYLKDKIDIRNINARTQNELESIVLKIYEAGKDKTITELDIGIYILEENENLLSKHIETMEDEIQNCLKNAKIHLAQKHRHSAKVCLIKKHSLEKRLQKKINALHNIQNLLEQIKDSHTDAHIWEAYKSALNAFNKTYTDIGLTEEAVEDTMLKLGEVLEINEDIQSALAHQILEDNSSDIENELEELLKGSHSNKDPPPDDESGLSDDLENRFQKLKIPLPNVPDTNVLMPECV
ncbi:charged multivesicular body protein 7 [Cylas formicarius]|uniref:charged multivesicular body protein 7 n=1 Tax=Cylas formicarius TaxID=197179 RepID=UPI0029587FA4|nr:charged multivesicular body protein 7 [Cylas formicarius]